MNPSANSQNPQDARALAFDPGQPPQTFAPLQPVPRGNDEGNPARQLDALDNNPRYLVLHRFHSRFLPDDRNIEVYLPEAYLTEPERRFPVFYLHDGQNLFDGRTSYIPGRTWRAHTTADRLTRAGLIDPLILVGIDNTGLRRMAEYTPTRDPHLRGGDGDRYGCLLVEELKPLIDRTFRTLPDPAHTALGGSSLGGLISLYIGLAYADVFSKLALLSPSIWWDNHSILRVLPAASRHKPPLRIWLDMGTAEGLGHLRDIDQLYRRLLQRGWRDSATLGNQRDSATLGDPSDGLDLHYARIPNGLHNEDAWAARFDQVLRFLFPSTFDNKMTIDPLQPIAKTLGIRDT